MTTGNIMGGYGKQFRNDCRVSYILDETDDGWHHFGMDWKSDGYVFYCDGKEVSRCSDYISQVLQFILFTTEVQGYRSVKSGKVKLLNYGIAEDYPFIIKD